jgi:Tol biopolymer transport system component
LTLDSESYTTDWSADGRFIAYESFDPATGWDCWLLPVNGDHKPQAILKSPFDERELQFSPDGNWIAYTANLSGRNEVYVQRFPVAGNPKLVSSNGGAQPRWSRDTHELFYVAADKNLMTVPLKMSPDLTAGPPTALFRARVNIGQVFTGSARNMYDVSPDGQRFLINTIVERPTAEITVTTSWPTTLKRQ